MLYSLAVIWPRCSREEKRDPSPSCSLPGGVVEGGRENWLWAAVCHIQMYGRCYCHNKIQSGQCPPESSVVIEFGLYLGDMKEPCPLSPIRDLDKDSSKRDSETHGDYMPISLHTYPCWLLTFKRPSHLEMLTWSLFSFGPLALSVYWGAECYR